MLWCRTKVYDASQTKQRNSFNDVGKREPFGYEGKHANPLAAQFAEIKENINSKDQSYFQDDARKPINNWLKFAA